jgi:DNA replication protein DnaC
LGHLCSVGVELVVRAKGWPAARYLATLLEHELAERYQRRIQRHLQEAELSAGWPHSTSPQFR